MLGKPFIVSEFTNPSGEIIYRLCGWDQGQRIRKNFTTRAEAEAERQARELARLQAATGMRVAATMISTWCRDCLGISQRRVSNRTQPERS